MSERKRTGLGDGPPLPSERALQAAYRRIEKKFPLRRQVKLGVIEFHSERFNPGLIEHFYRVVKDLRDSGSIVDVWLMDIATVLKHHGYEMEIHTKRGAA